MYEYDEAAPKFDVFLKWREFIELGGILSINLAVFNLSKSVRSNQALVSILNFLIMFLF